MDRRTFLSVLAGGTAVVLTGRLGWARAPYREGPLLAEPQVRAVLGAVQVGTRIDRWTVVSILDTAHGGIPVVLATSTGERFRVDVLRRDDHALGVANTAELSLYLCNQGRGSRATDEEHGLGAMALARRLERGAAPHAPLPRLLTLRERNQRFRDGAFSVVG